MLLGFQMFFSYGLGNSLLLPVPLRRGNSSLARKTRSRKILQVIEKYRPTFFFPYRPFSHASARRKEYDLSSLRICLSSGEPLPPAIFHQWKERPALSFWLSWLHRSNSRLSRQSPGKSQGRKQRRSHPAFEAKSSTTRGVRCRWAKWEVSWSRETPIRPMWNKHEQTKKMMQGEWLKTGDTYCRC